jgi:predicted nucleotidyltransferase
MPIARLPLVTAEQIRSYTARIAEEFQPERIILFGSYAYGAPHADSDVDLLVIMPFEGDSARKAAEIRHKVRAGFPVDLLVRTPSQVEQRLELNDWFMREIVEKGTIVYAAAHHGVGRES